MTKLTVEQNLSVDWMDHLEGMNREQAVEWINHNVPEGYYLDSEWCYESKNGVLTTERLETDEEEATREAAEAKVKADREYQAEWTRLRRIEDAEYLAKSQSATEVSLAIYLQKHKGNAKIDDLKNLFMALVQLERDGHPDSGAAMREVRECMELLEKQ